MTDNTRRERQQRRRAALNEAARRLGYDSWAKLETAVINGQAHLKVLKDDPAVMWYGYIDLDAEYADIARERIKQQTITNAN